MDAIRPTRFAEPAAGPRTATAMFRSFPVQSGIIAPDRTVTSRASSGVRHHSGAADRYFPVQILRNDRAGRRLDRHVPVLSGIFRYNPGSSHRNGRSGPAPCPASDTVVLPGRPGLSGTFRYISPHLGGVRPLCGGAPEPARP